MNPLQRKEPILAEAMFLVVFSHDLQSCKLPVLAAFQASTLESLEHVYFLEVFVPLLFNKQFRSFRHRFRRHFDDATAGMVSPWVILGGIGIPPGVL